MKRKIKMTKVEGHSYVCEICLENKICRIRGCKDDCELKCTRCIRSLKNGNIVKEDGNG